MQFVSHLYHTIFFSITQSKNPPRLLAHLHIQSDIKKRAHNRKVMRTLAGAGDLEKWLKQWLFKG